MTRVFVVHRLNAGQDAVAMVATLQAQFPQDAIHLLVGFDPREVYCRDGDERGDNPVEIASDDPRWGAYYADEHRPNANVMARHCTVGRIILVSVPPAEDEVFHAQNLVNIEAIAGLMEEQNALLRGAA